MRHAILLTAVSMMSVAAAAGAAGPGAVLGPPAAAEQTGCDDLGTICATSKTVASASCVPIDLVTVKCSGSATVGGAGSSPAGLPGTADWTGSAACSGTCGDPASGNANGLAAWPGFGVNGAGTEQTIVLGPVTQTLLTGCITFTVTALADAHAATFLSVPGVLDLPVTEATAPQAQDSASATICGPLG